METHQEHRTRLSEVEEELWQLNFGRQEVGGSSPPKTLTETATARQLQANFMRMDDYGEVLESGNVGGTETPITPQLHHVMIPGGDCNVNSGGSGLETAGKRPTKVTIDEGQGASQGASQEVETQ